VLMRDTECPSAQRKKKQRITKRRRIKVIKKQRVESPVVFVVYRNRPLLFTLYFWLLAEGQSLSKKVSLEY
jgi:hypothetical protein